MNIAALFAALAIASPVARHEVVRSGATEAVLSYTVGSSSGWHTRLLISRAGRVVFDRPVAPLRRFGGRFEAVPARWNQGRSITLRRLDGEADPQVVVDFDSEGAHCCEWSRIYRYVPSRSAYAVTTAFWGNAGYEFRRIGARTLFATGDDSFAYRFTDYADSVDPIELLTFRSGRFVGVTREYPAQVRTNAVRWWRDAMARRGRQEHEIRGLIAAWTADEYLLGRRRAADATLDRLAASGALDPMASSQPHTSAHAYVTALRRFLTVRGY